MQKNYVLRPHEIIQLEINFCTQTVAFLSNAFLMQVFIACDLPVPGFPFISINFFQSSSTGEAAGVEVAVQCGCSSTTSLSSEFSFSKQECCHRRTFYLLKPIYTQQTFLC